MECRQPALRRVEHVIACPKRMRHAAPVVEHLGVLCRHSDEMIPVALVLPLPLLVTDAFGSRADDAPSREQRLADADRPDVPRLQMCWEATENRVGKGEVVADVLEPVIDIAEPIGEAFQRQGHPAVRRRDAEMRVAPHHQLAQCCRMRERYMPCLVERIDDHLPVGVEFQREAKPRVEPFEPVEAEFLADHAEISHQIGHIVRQAQPDEATPFLGAYDRSAQPLQSCGVE